MEAQTLPEKFWMLSEKDRLAIETLIDSLVGKAADADDSKPRQRRKVLGALKGNLLYMAPDFDEPMEDFKDYM